MQPRVPIDFSEVKSKAAIRLVLYKKSSVTELSQGGSSHMFNDIFWFARDEFHVKESELIVDSVEFIDHSLNLVVFLECNVRQESQDPCE